MLTYPGKESEVTVCHEAKTSLVCDVRINLTMLWLSCYSGFVLLEGLMRFRENSDKSNLFCYSDPH